jgi:F-type H+-transporting ATPase subunit alpha
MEEQIYVLLALTAGLFDLVPLDKMNEAQQAVQKATAKLPADLVKRLTSADKLNDADRKSILDVARQALESFIPKPASKPKS